MARGGGALGRGRDARSPAARHQKRYLCSLRQVGLLLGKLDLAQINGAQLAAIVSRKGPTNATKRRDLTAVLAVLYAAESWGWIEKAPDPRPTLRLVPERRDPIVLPTGADVDQLVATAPAPLGVLVVVPGAHGNAARGGGQPGVVADQRW